MMTLHFVYTIAGIVFAGFALLTVRDKAHPRRFGSAVFWGLLALSFLAGDALGDRGNGLLVILLVALAGTGQLRRGAGATTSPDERRISAERHGNGLFLCALIVPAVALIGTFAIKAWPAIADPKQATLIALTIGILIALAVAIVWLRPRAATPLQEGRRLIEMVGWAAILPQMLASLGAVFALAGVGNAVGTIAGHLIPDGSRTGAVIVYGIGMLLFTTVMGNAFAAFPVMTAAIGVPLLIKHYGGDPAVIGAIGMLCGFSGTLLTPMAANFNIVPAALLDLKDRYGVIRAQAPTALLVFVINLFLLTWLPWR